jgi:hypothetical protein
MAVAIKTKKGTIGPTVTDGPKHCLAAQFIEAVRRINE